MGEPAITWPNDDPVQLPIYAKPAITWPNDDPVQWPMYASTDFNTYI